MKNLQFPLDFRFKISTLSNDFVATDATGHTVAYVRQKMFKFKEAVNVYADESKRELLYSIKANKWLDWSAAYGFTDASGAQLGKVARKGWKSLWKAQYLVIDQNNEQQYKIEEESAFTRFADGLLGEIPVLGFFTGYVFNPVYNVTDMQGNVVVKLKKNPSFFGRKFVVEKIKDVEQDDKERIMLSLMMMILLERNRG